MEQDDMLHTDLDDEQLIPDAADEATPTEAPKNAFRERLDEPEADLYEEDFAATIDSAANPHLVDQLDDENLQREAEADYR
ncbi:hypothetical protein HJC99_02365 [Candidatus Saccharibacteria bacterium]|nr:hypothetical protein [Candidatus Saccharibacteria bacterium]